MSLLDDPAHWQSRALDIRRLADASTDLVYRTKLQKIAAPSARWRVSPQSRA
jgi:hypothetical protein